MFIVMIKTYNQWAIEYPNYVVLRKEGYYYTARNESAQVLHDLLGYKLGISGQNLMTGSPVLQPVVDALVFNKINYIVIEDGEIIDKQEFEGGDIVFGYYSSCNTKINDKQYSNGKDNLISNNTSIINNVDLLNYINSLLVGVDPFTGELLERDHIINRSQTKEILMLSKRIIEKRNAGDKPKLAGVKWTKNEDEQLKKEYLAQISVDEIARIHQRTTGAIYSRIIKLFPELIAEGIDITK